MNKLRKILEKYKNQLANLWECEPKCPVKALNYQRELSQAITKLFLESLPEERTEGILVIGGTLHKDGVVNEGFNDCLDQITERWSDE